VSDEEVDMKSYWSVDQIIRGDEVDLEDRRSSLVRFVHLTEEGPGGIRYFYVGDECLASGESRATRGFPFQQFHYGRVYEFDEGGIRGTRKPKRMGVSREFVPVIRRRELTDYARRNLSVEDEIRAEIEGFFEGAAGMEGFRRRARPKRGRGGGKRREPSPAKVIVFNAGQGDTILVEFPDGGLWLVDAYFWRDKKYDDFVRWIRKEYGAGKRFERLIISHFHYDHIRCAARAVVDFRPEIVVVPDTLPHTTGTTRNFLRVARKQSELRKLSGPEDVNVEGLEVRLVRTVDFPAVRPLGRDPNEHAIAVVIKTGGSRALLSGDIPGDMLRCLTSDPFLAAADDAYRFYKVTHHCSRTGNDEAFFETFPPTDAVTSCASTNRYNHPHNPPREVITRLTSGRHDFTFNTGTPYVYVIK
jgi:beta-lactamase superfamily II metal-dependent hydrolase